MEAHTLVGNSLFTGLAKFAEVKHSALKSQKKSTSLLTGRAFFCHIFITQIKSFKNFQQQAV